MDKIPVDSMIFDLDGTLIESKWDIAQSVNFTLVELGLPERPIEEIFGFVGDGVKRLLRLAVGEGNQSSGGNRARRQRRCGGREARPRILLRQRGRWRSPDFRA